MHIRKCSFPVWEISRSGENSLHATKLRESHQTEIPACLCTYIFLPVLSRENGLCQLIITKVSSAKLVIDEKTQSKQCTAVGNRHHSNEVMKALGIPQSLIFEMRRGIIY
jgi:hypothetical protein